MSWAAELVELAAVFLAVGIAHLFVSTLGEHAGSTTLLMFSAAALVSSAVLHRCWGARRRRHAARTTGPPQRAATLPDLLSLPASGQDLLRLRTTLPDRPGTLAALAGKLAALDVNILAVQIHPCMRGAVDELLIAVPRSLSTAEVIAAVAAGGGESTEAGPADLHDLVDPATRALTLAADATGDARQLPGALLKLLSADVVTGHRPAGMPATAQLRGPTGEPLFLGRRTPAFTPTELSRAQALVDLCVRTAARTTGRA